jgi:hypothetical protein
MSRNMSVARSSNVNNSDVNSNVNYIVDDGDSGLC